MGSKNNSELGCMKRLMKKKNSESSAKPRGSPAPYVSCAKKDYDDRVQAVALALYTSDIHKIRLFDGAQKDCASGFLELPRGISDNYRRLAIAAVGAIIEMEQ